MTRSSTRGIFLSIVILFSIVIITIPSNVYGAEILVTSVGLGETSLLKLTNESDEEIAALRIWLGNDYNFKSFKTENGWSGKQNEHGVIIFSSSKFIKSGESVKFGVKSDKPAPAINWKALDKKDTPVGTGISIVEKLSETAKDPETDKDPETAKVSETNQDSKNPSPSMTTESTFRVVPEKPNVGSSIRVTGDNFGSLQEFDFYIDTQKLGTFETDKNGHFMTTMKIPDDQKADRVDFKIQDKEGQEKKLSLRVGELDNRIPESENISLTIQGAPTIMHRGDFLEIFGTGDPNSTITIEINTSEEKILNSRTAEINSKGYWKLEPIVVALDTPFGRYSATITDGRESQLIYWNVESDKKIHVYPTSLKFELGEVIKFNGTAIPNKPIDFILEDPLGNEIDSNRVQVNDTGFVEFMFITTPNTQEGTYTLISTQEKEKEITYVGLGQLPTIPVNLVFDKFNYKSGETAIVTISGKASETISLLVIDPFNKPVRNSTSITLEPDGTGTHTIELKGYASGAYTAVIGKGSAKSDEIFTVGLQTGSGDIEINTTKLDYHPGDPVLILGKTDSDDVLLTITMTDPDGNIIKTKETFSDKGYKKSTSSDDEYYYQISPISFKIPSNAILGIWTIRAQSGSNLDEIKIDVLKAVDDGLQVSVTQEKGIPGFDKSLNIHVIGAQQTVQIEIIDKDGKVIEKLTSQASGGGEINQPWGIPSDIGPGTYTIKITDSHNSHESTFEIQ